MRNKWQDWLMLILGIWLFVSPFFLAYVAGSQAMWNATIVGALIVLFAITAIARPGIWGEWVNLVLGMWLIISAFILEHPSGVSQWNHLIIGVLVAADALAAVIMRPEQTKPLPPMT